MKMNMSAKQVYSLMVFVGFSICVAGVSAHAEDYDLAPKYKSYAISPNESFLIDLKRGTEQESREINDKVLDQKTTRNLNEQYSDMNREFELKEQYHLNDRYTEMQQSNHNGDFGKFYLRNIMSYQITEGWKRAEKHSDEVRTFRRTQEKVQKVMESPVNVSVDEHTKFGTKTDLPAERGQVWMKSRVVDGNFDVVLGKGFQLNPMSKTNTDPFTEERYRLSLNKDLGFWGMSAHSSYALESTKVNHSLNKSITPALSASVATTRAFDQGRAGNGFQPEQTVQMNYGIHF